MRVNDFLIEELEEYFRFDDTTGDLFWRKAPSLFHPHLVGRVIRYKDGRGYYTVGFKGAMLLVSHIAFRLLTGDIMPEGGRIDHINGNRLDNHPCNLRLATRSQNAMNSRPRLRCTSRYKGVYFNKEFRRWEARIKKDGVRHFLGRFEDENAAAEIYNRAAKELFGEFKQLNIVGRK